MFPRHPHQATRPQPPPLPPPQTSLSSSHAQNRFDEVFMTQTSSVPTPPPAPPRTPPLVPQQIRRKPGLAKGPSQEADSAVANYGKSVSDKLSCEEAMGIEATSGIDGGHKTNLDTREREEEPETNAKKRQKASNSSSTQNKMRSECTSLPSLGDSLHEEAPNSSVVTSRRDTADPLKISCDERQKKRKQLELLRAKVALAKQRKKEMEKEANKKDTKGALERARAKLRGAMHERAKVENRIPPLSGLSTSLIVSKISETGPEDMVYFPNSNLGVDLGLRSLDELFQSGGKGSGTVGETSSTLAARKSQLQRELLLLKEKLESKQNASSAIGLQGIKDQVSDTASEGKSPYASQQILTKQELERRREEAQAQMDLSYWRHFVSKQEHILTNVTRQLQENSASLHFCNSELENTSESTETVESEIQDLAIRKKILEGMISESSSDLMKKRMEFHEHQAKQSSESS